MISDSFIIVNIIKKGASGTNVNRPGLPDVLGHIELNFTVLPSDSKRLFKTFIQARMYYMFRNKLLLYYYYYIDVSIYRMFINKREC